MRDSRCCCELSHRAVRGLHLVQVASPPKMMTSELTSSSEFNPRLRLDLNSGNASLRSLNDSVTKLRTRGELGPGGHAGDASGSALIPPVADFEKTISLMKGRHTRDMHERHIGSIRKICAVCARGIFLHDLESSRELLALAAARMLQGVAGYDEAVGMLFETLSVPFQKGRASDEGRYAEQVQAIGVAAAEVALKAPPPIAGSALEMLLSLGVPPPPPTSTAEALAREAMTIGPRMETARMLNLLSTSGALPLVLRALKRGVSESSATANQMRVSSRAGSHLGTPPVWERAISAGLKLLRAATRTPEGAEAVLSASADDVEVLVERLTLPLSSPLLSVAVETVWNLLEARPAATADLLCTPAVVPLLSYLHERTLRGSSSDTDRELRNEVLVLSTLLAKSATPSGRAALVAGGLYQCILAVLCLDAAVRRAAAPCPTAPAAHPRTRPTRPTTPDHARTLTSRRRRSSIRRTSTSR